MYSIQYTIYYYIQYSAMMVAVDTYVKDNKLSFSLSNMNCFFIINKVNKEIFCSTSSYIIQQQDFFF
jgi:hypothetical protein